MFGNLLKTLKTFKNENKKEAKEIDPKEFLETYNSRLKEFQYTKTSPSLAFVPAV